MSHAWQQLRRDYPALVGLSFILLFSGAALTAPWISPFDPTEQFFDGLTLEGAPKPPSSKYLLGTDLLGRDLLSRLIYGARTSLIIGVVANGAAVLVGTLLGIIAGYVQGWVGAVIMRFTDLMMAFPALLLAIALAAIFAPSLWIVAMVIALVNWVQIALESGFFDQSHLIRDFRRFAGDSPDSFLSDQTSFAHSVNQV